MRLNGTLARVFGCRKGSSVILPMPDQSAAIPGNVLTPIGLCLTCRHVRVVQNAHSSTFYLCRRAEDDARFARYPRLPVLRCAGYEPAEESEDAASHPSPGTVS